MKIPQDERSAFDGGRVPGWDQGRAGACDGFTLIELLLVTVIIGVLATIAIPSFARYRARAFNLRANSDLRNVITAQEDFYLDGEQYLSCENDECNAPSLRGFTLSDGVELEVVADNANDRFTAEASHVQGDATFTYESAPS